MFLIDSFNLDALEDVSFSVGQLVPIPNPSVCDLFLIFSTRDNIMAMVLGSLTRHPRHRVHSALRKPNLLPASRVGNGDFLHYYCGTHFHRAEAALGHKFLSNRIRQWCLSRGALQERRKEKSSNSRDYSKTHCLSISTCHVHRFDPAGPGAVLQRAALAPGLRGVLVYCDGDCEHQVNIDNIGV